MPRTTRIALLLLIAAALHAPPVLPAAAAPPWPSRELIDYGTGRVTGVAFSPDGTFLASVDGNGKLAVRMFPGLRMFAQLHGSQCTSVAWSPDGEVLVAGGFDGL